MAIPPLPMKPLSDIRTEIEIASNEMKGGFLSKAVHVCKTYLDDVALVDEKILSSVYLLQSRLLWTSTDLKIKQTAVSHAVTATLVDFGNNEALLFLGMLFKHFKMFSDAVRFAFDKIMEREQRDSPYYDLASQEKVAILDSVRKGAVSDHFSYVMPYMRHASEVFASREMYLIAHRINKHVEENIISGIEYHNMASDAAHFEQHHKEALLYCRNAERLEPYCPVTANLLAILCWKYRHDEFANYHTLIREAQSYALQSLKLRNSEKVRDWFDGIRNSIVKEEEMRRERDLKESTPASFTATNHGTRAGDIPTNCSPEPQNTWQSTLWSKFSANSDIPTVDLEHPILTVDLEHSIGDENTMELSPAPIGTLGVANVPAPESTPTSITTERCATFTSELVAQPAAAVETSPTPDVIFISVPPPIITTDEMRQSILEESAALIDSIISESQLAEAQPASSSPRVSSTTVGIEPETICTDSVLQEGSSSMIESTQVTDPVPSVHLPISQRSKRRSTRDDSDEDWVPGEYSIPQRKKSFPPPAITVSSPTSTRLVIRIPNKYSVTDSIDDAPSSDTDCN